MHLTPAGLPSGIPGMGEDIETAIQHAPQPGLHSIEFVILANMVINVILE
jgi:elongation factor P